MTFLSSSIRLVAVTALLLVLPGGPAQSQTPIVYWGDKFQANEGPSSGRDSAIAVSPTGDFIVTWYDRSSQTDRFVGGQLFGADGERIGSEFRVSTYPLDNRAYQHVPAMGQDGKAFVVWTSPALQDPSFGVQGRHVSSGGVPLGAEFQVNTYTTGVQSPSGVISQTGGDFVVLWSSEGSNGDDMSGFSTQARRVPADGAPVASEIQVNSRTTGDQFASSLSADDGQSSIAVWQNDESYPNSDETDLYAQRIDASGTPFGSAVQINETPTWRPRSTATSFSDGGFLVVWSDRDFPLQDYRVRARRFDSAGTALTAEITVEAPQVPFPGLGTDAEGDFVVVYDVQYEPQGLRFRSDGTPVGEAFFLANPSSGVFSWEPVVGVFPHGDFVAVWEDFSGRIYGQQFRVTADIGDRVWLDENANGIQDSGEPGVPDVLIRLKDGSGELLASTRTDEGGHFVFRPKIALEGVIDKFYLKFVAPHAMAFTRQDVGLGSFEDADSDADPLTGKTALLLIESAGEVHLDIDAGLVDDSGIFSDGFESGDMTAWSESPGR